MSEECRTRTPDPIALTRRAAGRRLGGGLLIMTLVLLRSSPERRAQDARSDTEAVFTGETFLAETRSGLFIAVVIGPSEAGTANRPARAFLCNDQRGGQLFVGELVGDQLTLILEPEKRAVTPQPDTRLIGTFGAGGCRGRVYGGDLSRGD